MIELETVYGEHLSYVSQVNKWYEIYKGVQKWELPSGLDFTPTQNITNFVKKLIDKKARFMFGKQPYFDLRTRDENLEKLVEQKEALLQEILNKNKFHSKLLKAKKDCSIGGRVAIRLWAEGDDIRIVFSPAQEFFPVYEVDDIDTLEKVYFMYTTKDSSEKSEQRIVKQKYEMIDGVCHVEEGIYDGYGELVQRVHDSQPNGLDFIPVTIITNGGLTGEVKGDSDVEMLWSNQDSYNKLKSDDIDSLKFNMFPILVATDVAGETIERMVIAPNALVDLKSDRTLDKIQGGLSKLEGTFAYTDKYRESITRIKDDMHELMDVPNTSTGQLKGTITSGKSMQVLYWDLQAVCEEEWTEWRPALTQVVNQIFALVSAYGTPENKKLADIKSELFIHHYYMNPEDEDAERRLDLIEVQQFVRSRESYIKKWGDELESGTQLGTIVEEKTQLEHGAYSELLSLPKRNIDLD